MRRRTISILTAICLALGLTVGLAAPAQAYTRVCSLLSGGLAGYGTRTVSGFAWPLNRKLVGSATGYYREERWGPDRIWRFWYYNAQGIYYGPNTTRNPATWYGRSDVSYNLLVNWQADGWGLRPRASCAIYFPANT